MTREQSRALVYKCRLSPVCPRASPSHLSEAIFYLPGTHQVGQAGWPVSRGHCTPTCPAYSCVPRGQTQIPIRVLAPKGALLSPGSLHPMASDSTTVSILFPRRLALENSVSIFLPYPSLLLLTNKIYSGQFCHSEKYHSDSCETQSSASHLRGDVLMRKMALDNHLLADLSLHLKYGNFLGITTACQVLLQVPNRAGSSHTAAELLKLVWNETDSKCKASARFQTSY